MFTFCLGSHTQREGRIFRMQARKKHSRHAATTNQEKNHRIKSKQHSRAQRNRANKKGEEVVASTSGSRIDARDFTQRRSNTDDDEGDGEPSPDDVDRTTSDERVVESRSQTVGNRSQHKGHEGDLKGGTVARKLRLVSEGLEEGISRLGFGRASNLALDFGIHVAIVARVVFVDAMRHVQRLREEKKKKPMSRGREGREGPRVDRRKEDETRQGCLYQPCVEE